MTVNPKSGSEYQVNVQARFVNKDNVPITGQEYRAMLWDEDFFDDDFIGPAELDEEGRVKFQFPLLASIRSWDSPFETRPDLYIVLELNGKEIFRTPVSKNADFHIEDSSQFAKRLRTINLGTFQVQLNG